MFFQVAFGLNPIHDETRYYSLLQFNPFLERHSFPYPNLPTLGYLGVSQLMQEAIVFE
jgi:hypothetical protein